MKLAMFFFYAALAGTFGALSGVAGKLSVADTFQYATEWLRLVFFTFNGICTAQMWRYYLKALANGPTPMCSIVSTGTNFVLSAVCGILIFGETVNALWCVGAGLVVGGLAVIATAEKTKVE